MTKAPKTGVMICGHGSRSQSAVDEFATLADKLPAYLPDDWQTEYGYLEFANPVIRDGLDKLREAGCERILAVPDARQERHPHGAQYLCAKTWDADQLWPRTRR